MLRLAAVLALVALAGSAGARSLPAPCDLGRFLTADGKHVLGRDLVAPAVEAIALDPTGISISTGCAAAAPVYRTNRRGTLVRAAWTSCAGAPGKVKLRALLARRRCDTLRGVLTVAKGKPVRRKVRATRAPFQYDVAL